jgi:hypothetical protein
MHETRARVFPQRIFFRGAWVLIACVLLFGCGRNDPEGELRAAIGQMASAIEQRKPTALLEHLAEDFTRESDAFGKRDVGRLLVGVLLRNEKITVNAAVTSVRITGDRARTKVRVFATGGSGLLPERGQTWEFDAGWRRENGAWRVFNAEWREGI